jgi:hypothetical protein
MSLARCCSHRKAHRDTARTMFARHLQLVVEGFDTTDPKEVKALLYPLSV